MAHRLVTWGIPVLLALSGGALVAQQADDAQFMTGAEPVSPEDYAKLPKQGRFRAYLPKRVDLSNAYPPPGSQGPQPNCVAWATTYAARTFLNFRDKDVQPAQPADQMSPAYVYNRLRPAGSPCTGTISIVQALTLLKNEGTVSLAEFPDDMTRCAIPAPDALKAKAGDFRLLDWRAIDREVKDDWRTPIILDDVKGALARGAPVIFAMPAPADFKAFRGDGVYARADKPDKANYHAMAIVGYDEDRQALRIMNSWGPEWGDKGYAWIDYATFKLLTGEAYSLEAPIAPATPGAPPPPRTAAQIFADAQAAIPCGTVAVQGRSVTGFSGDLNAIAALRAAAAKADPRLDFAVRHLPWPQCEAALTLAAPLAREGTGIAVLTESGAPRSGDPVTMRENEIFGVSATTSAARPYLSIIYLQADGSAVELHRGHPEPDRKGVRRVTIGLSQTAQRYQVAPPFGPELIVALASEKPLFGDDEVVNGTERQFLTRLRARLAAQRGDGVAAAFVRLQTSN
ncbi:C1 family peptidase [Sphingobium sp. HBC34]|uniref:C1 family peptidase n=1 Tax=Sphingobium cyanobacteriorum TaxID=3063954 RepID=A0ABT8ZPT4_9SPHN|nr:C1 family peptidase [Sphingobium sp. HBC34]MDO7836549.1 C1 family peptidase [Sphingobium sp. HBC34]